MKYLDEVAERHSNYFFLSFIYPKLILSLVPSESLKPSSIKILIISLCFGDGSGEKKRRKKNSLEKPVIFDMVVAKN